MKAATPLLFLVIFLTYLLCWIPELLVDEEFEQKRTNFCQEHCHHFEVRSLQNQASRYSLLCYLQG
jgi:hypothetical protein